MFQQYTIFGAFLLGKKRGKRSLFRFCWDGAAD